MVSKHMRLSFNWRFSRSKSVPKSASVSASESLIPPAPVTQDSLLFRFPIDIYFAILSHLPPSSALALSLTCKAFWSHTPASLLRTINTDHPQRLAFLALLDPSLPHHIPCALCLTAHARSPHEAAQCIGLSPARPCAKAISPVPICDHLVVPYELLSLILRAHQLDPAYGLPVSTLAHSCTSSSKVSAGNTTVTVPVSLTVIPRIVQFRLLLRLDYTVSIDSDRDLEAQIRGMRAKVCRHSGPLFVARCLHELRDMLNRQHGRSASAQSVNTIQSVRTARSSSTQGISEDAERGGAASCFVQMCRWCATEADMCVQMGSDSGNESSGRARGLWRMRIRVWKDLGPRLAPMQQPWIGQSRAEPGSEMEWPVRVRAMFEGATDWGMRRE